MDPRNRQFWENVIIVLSVFVRLTDLPSKQETAQKDHQNNHSFWIKMKHDFYFVHGWGFNEEFWKPVREILESEGVSGFSEIIDMNFFSNKSLQVIPTWCYI